MNDDLLQANYYSLPDIDIVSNCVGSKIVAASLCS